MPQSTLPSTLESRAPVRFVDLQRQYCELKTEIDAAIQSVFARAGFILGSEVAAFEEEFADYCGAEHCVGVGSGLDALTLILKGLGIGRGDEVILPGNTFIATALAVTHAGATPVLVDHDPTDFTLDPGCFAAAISGRTKAVIPVHLYGQMADMDRINAIAAEHGLIVVEDAAQAHGATCHGRRCGSFGRAAGFSFYPGKNLGGAGDGGAVVTDDEGLDAWLRKARNYGSSVKHQHDLGGYNTRLDGVQAAVLRVKLRHLDRWNDLRRQFAEDYRVRLAGLPIALPATGRNRTHVYHLYVIRCGQRDALVSFLEDSGVSAGIHYPVPIHLQPAYRRRCLVPEHLRFTEHYAHQILSLPMHPHMTPEDVEYVVQCLHEFPGNLSIVDQPLSVGA